MKEKKKLLNKKKNKQPREQKGKLVPGGHSKRKGIMNVT